MSSLPARFVRHYGTHPLHLLTMVAGFALLGYILATFKLTTLWNPQSWWQSIIVWFAAAVIGHDLILFPLYALADRLLSRREPKPGPKAAARNYIRVPAAGAALTLVIFLPGIIQQGATTYHAATGETQQPFLGRWLLLTAAMFAISALAYAARFAKGRYSAGKTPLEQGK
ncbi:hypothetical protein [Mycobacterium angelicum]|uniref:Uncharacterized protein n=1 Tax=Mycobacterium angelicum TaxID=470074 RepID=A0A1W9ZGH0_MYCAN|nr:hypothetical protein [Mycobacterium angelicum]MCV7195630.1 hypothetical protein [Mycobacterium angelicum]ORA14458.1 hypothetical protein BST12_22805 [Mycobacterium angelicum]